MGNYRANKKNIIHFSFYCLLSLSIINFINCQNNIAVVPFKSFLPKSNSPNTNIASISSWIYRMLYLNIETESDQSLSMVLTLEPALIHTNHMAAYFRDPEGADERYVADISNVCSFNFKASNTYKLLTDFNYTYYSKSHSCFASEKIILYRDINLKEKSTNEIKFIHSSNDTQNCFCAGLVETTNLNENYYSFFYQFKHLINSKSFPYLFSFNNNDEGKFIFGDIINNNNLKFYNDNEDKNYLSVKQNSFFSKQIHYQIKINKLFIGNYMNETNTHFKIDIHKRYITVSKYLFNKIKEEYMLDTSTEDSMCKMVNPGRFYYAIYCDKEKYLKQTNNYKKLPNLILLYGEENYNFTFTPQELFLEKDGYVYFFVGYGVKYAYDEDDISSRDNTFSLGSIFLQKYVTVFHDEAKILYILKEHEEIETPSDNFVVKIIIIAILIFALCAIIFVIIGKLYGKQLFGGRKKKANELNDDDFDYISKEVNDDNKNEGLFKENEDNSKNGA